MSSVDELSLLLQVGDDPAGRPLHLPYRGRRLRHHDEEHTRADRVRLEVLRGDQVLALPGLAVDQRDAVGGRPGLHPAGEPARHPHQAGVIELLVAASVQLPPPDPEPARAVTQREVGVQHDPVHAVIGTPQQIPVPLSEVIGHPPTVELSGFSRQPDCPKGPFLPGEVPEGT
jgi:hypothetical protein